MKRTSRILTLILALAVIVGAIVFTKEFRKFKKKVQLDSEKESVLKTAIQYKI